MGSPTPQLFFGEGGGHMDVVDDGIWGAGAGGAVVGGGGDDAHVPVSNFSSSVLTL